MALFMPYSGDGFASISVKSPYYGFSLAYRFVVAKAAIALAILLCFDLFGFEEHFFSLVEKHTVI